MSAPWRTEDIRWPCARVSSALDGGGRIDPGRPLALPVRASGVPVAGRIEPADSTALVERSPGGRVRSRDGSVPETDTLRLVSRARRAVPLRHWRRFGAER